MTINALHQPVSDAALAAFRPLWYDLNKNGVAHEVQSYEAEGCTYHTDVYAFQGDYAPSNQTGYVFNLVISTGHDAGIPSHNPLFDWLHERDRTSMQYLSQVLQELRPQQVMLKIPGLGGSQPAGAEALETTVVLRQVPEDRPDYLVSVVIEQATSSGPTPQEVVVGLYSPLMTRLMIQEDVNTYFEYNTTGQVEIGECKVTHQRMTQSELDAVQFWRGNGESIDSLRTYLATHSGMCPICWNNYLEAMSPANPLIPDDIPF